MVHELLAKATRCPEIAFDEKESETVGNAFMNVLRHYDVKPQQKATDWINLVMCLSIVYGGRYSKITSRHAQERKDKKAALAEQNAGAAPFGIVN
jgi:hypothetical protein